MIRTRAWLVLLLCIVVARPSGGSETTGTSSDDPSRRDAVTRSRTPTESAGRDSDLCSAPAAGAPRPGEELGLPRMETSRPGPWRRQLKVDDPRTRVPGADAGQILSPRGPGGFEPDPGGRWVPGYRPTTPHAQAEFDAWKARQWSSQGQEPGALVRRAPSGTPQSNLWSSPGVVQEQPPAVEDVVDHVVRETKYPAFPVDLRRIDPSVPEGPKSRGTPSEFHHGSGLTWDEYNELKDRAKSTPPTPGAQEAGTDAPDPFGVSFVALESAGTNTPPDPIMAVGPNHIVGIVNARYQVWNKSGTPLTGDISLNSFFTGVSNCSGAFDVFA
ncbi:MAG: hypothetical protein R3344_13320, partial [Acidobacteriota bacterium]|nr:hypothetical protein [Acidobacteriota bacterium]